MVEAIGIGIGVFVVGVLAGMLYLSHYEWKKKGEARRKATAARWKNYFEMTDLRKTKAGIAKAK